MVINVIYYIILIQIISEMKVAIVEVRDRNTFLNKDQAGTFGTRIKSGGSILNFLIDRIKKSGVKLPIMYLGYVSALFQKYGHDVNYYVNKIPDKGEEITIMCSSIVDYITEIEFAKKIKNSIKTKVGFIGAFSSVRPDIFKDFSDFVIVGEPEDACTKIASLEIRPSGIIKSKPIENLDELPFPEWGGFPIREYSYFPVINEKPFLTIQSSRGCPYNCEYCPYLVMQGTKLRKRSADNVVDEIKHMHEKYGVRGVLFRDPVFTIDRKRTGKIANRLIEEDMNIKWCCETRLDCLDTDLIDLMKDAGLRSINVGVESYSRDILEKASRKAIDNKHQEEIINHCEDNGVKVSAFYILGFPDDTIESIRKTIDYAKKLNTTVAQFTILTPYPGTRYFEDVKGHITTDGFTNFDAYTPVIGCRNLSHEQLIQLKEKAFKGYYLRPGWIFRNLFKLIS